ncbi:pinopsin isoform X1 [Daphnia magna]|uniref:pinopsin isoform X1 n=1 Tax=Daphnia magna TaxID=35525 RepID=UPI001E1BDE9D|nr:pinopsin isoform X1 [Daphnia magna]
MANRTAFSCLCFLFLCGCAGSALNISEALFHREVGNGTQGHAVGFALNSTGWSIITGNISAGSTDLLMPEWVYLSAGAYLLFISAIGLFMNIVVVIIILNDPQKMTPLNWMLLNLACSDGAIAGFGTPVSAVAAWQLTWPFSHELCVAYAMIMSTAGIGSITTLTVLALWRCQHVIWYSAKRNGPFTDHNGRLGFRQGALLLTLIWTYTLAVTCPPLFGWGRYDREAAHLSCSVNWESKMDNNRSYIFYMFAMGLFVPLVAITVSYTSILIFIQKTSKMRRQLKSTLQLASTGQQNDNGGDPVEKKVTVMVAVMIGAFIMAWTPYSILALIETLISDTANMTDYSNTTIINRDGNFFYNGTVSPALATIPSLFAKTSAVLNPLIYGLLNTQVFINRIHSFSFFFKHQLLEQFRSAWKKFSSRFICRRKYRHKKRKCGNQNFAITNQEGRNNYLRRLFNCAGRSNSLAIVQRSSTKEMVSSYSQNASALPKQDASNTLIPPVPPNSQYDAVECEDLNV